MNKYILPFFLALVCVFTNNLAQAQLTDDFSDGDFTTNPTWTGEYYRGGLTSSAGYTVNAGQVQSNVPSGASGDRQAYLTTQILPAVDLTTSDYEWKFDVELTFTSPTSPDGNDHLKIHLAANQANLFDNTGNTPNATLNGYLLKIEDDIRLIRRTNGSDTNIPLSGGTTTVITTPFAYTITVTRTSAGVWEVFANGISQGTANETTYTTVDYVGVNYRFAASSRRASFLMDNVSLAPLLDTTPPKVNSVSVVNATTLDVTFDENVDLTSAQLAANYTITSGANTNTANSATRDVVDFKKVQVVFNSTFYDGNHLEVRNVKDAANNAIPSGTPATLFFSYDNIPPKINAILGIASNQLRLTFDENVNLPSAEVATNYVLDGGIGAATTANRDAVDFSKVDLTFASNLTIGNSYEITVNSVEDLNANAITNATATFVFADNVPPKIDHLQVVSLNGLDVYFDENVEQISAETLANYLEDDNNSNPVSAVRDATNFALVHLTFAQNFDDNTVINLSVNNITDLATPSNTMTVADTKPFIADTDKPDVCTTGCVIPLTSSTLLIQFDEEVDKTTAEILNSYEIKSPFNEFAIAAVRDANDFTKVKLTFATSFPVETEIEITVRNVLDLAGNKMTTRTRSFFLDNIPPQVTELRILSDTRLQLTFRENLDETTAENIANYTLDLPPNSPTTATLFDGNPRIVFLDFAVPLSANTDYVLSVVNVEDLFDTAMPLQTLNFSTTSPTIAKVSVLSNKELQIQYSEPTTFATTSLSANYNVNSGIGNPATITHTSATAIANLNFTTAFTPNRTYSLNVQNVADLNANSLANSNENFVYQSFVTDVVIVANNLVDVYFSSDVLKASAEIATKYTVNNSIGDAVSSIVDSDDGFIVHLAFAQNFVSGTTYTLTLGDIEMKNGKLQPEFQHTFELDTTPPKVVSVEIVNGSELDVYFDETVDEITAEALNFYFVNLGFGNPVDADLSTTDRKKVNLNFTSDFQFDNLYTLTIRDVRDLVGNQMTTQTFSFSLPVPPDAGELIFTEIMADPDPVVGLPNEEYLEIYNTSNQTFDLEGVKIKRGSSTTTLEKYTLGANQYLLLCRESAVPDFQALGVSNILGVSSITLTNSGSTLQIIAQDGDLVSEITYSDTFYRADSTREGGYSLELIDFNNDCRKAANWAESQDPSGGTPGKVNSYNNQNTDNQGVKLEKVQITANNKLNVKFEEEPDSVSMVRLANYSISGLTVSTIDFVDAQTVDLTFSANLNPSTVYTLITQNIEDCLGNLGRDTATFAQGARAAKYDLIITEIMADPDPKVGQPKDVEYLEIFNRSSKLINLSTVLLSDGTSTKVLPDEVISAGEYLILTTTSKADSFPNIRALGMVGFPSLANTGELLILRDTAGEFIFSVDYSDSWYGDVNKKNGGYSLEIIDPTNFCGEADNWKASEDPTGGTPALQNSVFASNLDTQNPELNFIELLGNQRLKVVYSEVMDSTSLVSLANYTIAGLSIASIEFVNFKEVILNFQSPIDENLGYTLTVSNTSDCVGNLASDSRNFGKGRMPLAGELLITEIMADPTPEVGLPDSEYLEIYNTSNDLISLGNVELRDSGNSRNLPDASIPANSYLLLVSTTQIANFPDVEALAVTSFPSLTNAGEVLELYNSNNELLHRVDYSDEWYGDEQKNDGGYSLEMIDLNNLCGEAENWKASQDPSGGTPSAQNSVFADNPDNTAPLVLNVEVISNTLLKVVFSEKMDTTSLKNLAAYQIDNIIAVSAVQLDGEKMVQLELNPALAPNTIYKLTISQLFDCSGNELEAVEFEFGEGIEAEFNDVLITEIFADPTPSVALPEREFIELFNRSNKIISLKSLVLRESSGDTPLPDVNLQAGEYITLSSTTASSEFAVFGKNVGVTGFPSLSNGGEKLALHNAADGNLIFSVEYSDDWYADAVKDDGGYTLEMIDTNNPCGEENNWTASLDASGGTPSRQNSVNGDNPDIKAPEIKTLTILDNQTLEVVFDEAADSLSMVDISNYQINNSIQITEITWLSTKQITLHLSPAIQSNVEYFLTAQNISDCVGNLSDSQQLSFGLGAFPSFGELLITEIMADPTPVVNLPESEYLEIYNPTNKLLTLGGLVLSDETGSTTLPFETLLPKEYVILCPTSSVDDFESFGRVIGVSNWRSLSNAGEQIELRNSTNELIFEIEYDDDWYRDAEKEDGGWSLEMIDPSNICGEQNNWTASENTKGGTPAAQNSVIASNADQRNPQIVRVDVLDAQTLEVIFDEKLDQNQALNFAAFTVDKGIVVTSQEIKDAKTVILTLASPIENKVLYTLTIGNLSDCVGNLLDNQSNTATFVLPEQGETGDIILNEIMFNPPSDGTDFVELYNNSDKYINLQDWKLSNHNDDAKTISETAVVMPPQTYLILTADKETILNLYQNVDENLIWEMSSLPSFPSDDGSVVLINNLDTEVDRFDYEDDFHFGLLQDDDGVSLERIDFDAPTNDPNNWHSASSDADFATPTKLNSQNVRSPLNNPSSDCISLNTEVITPDGDGFTDILQIRYECQKSGVLSTIKIYDATGREIRTLLQNQLISTSGFITWDGLDQNNKKTAIGYYVILIELYDLNGNTEIVKKKIVVGARF
jgi:hypothetical protein